VVARRRLSSGSRRAAAMAAEGRSLPKIVGEERKLAVRVIGWIWIVGEERERPRFCLGFLMGLAVLQLYWA